MTLKMLRVTSCGYKDCERLQGEVKREDSRSLRDT